MNDSRLDYWAFRFAAEKPLAKLLSGGCVTIKTSADNQVRISVSTNIATLHRKDINKLCNQSGRAAAGSLVLRRISQTDIYTGEVIGTPRRRKFTSEARRKIREGAAVIEQKYGKQAWVITLTLPGSTVQAIETLAEKDSEIKNAYLQNFRKLFARVCQSRRETLDYVCVSELQERGAIHYHIVVGWANRKFAKGVQAGYRRWWWKILLRYSENSGVDLFGDDSGGSFARKPMLLMLECSKVRERVSSYLAKYLSKAVSKEQLELVNSPSRWWSISSALREEVERQRLSFPILFDTHAQALAEVERVRAIIEDCRREIKRMISPWCAQFMGYVIFPEGERKHLLFEWIKELFRAPPVLQDCSDKLDFWEAVLETA